ncbi:MAG TPA: hypothetical protein VFS43_24180 [Polyangiaceae bacterium]|nr:hypothetical protein [Polyangiaceae bacterium]
MSRFETTPARRTPRPAPARPAPRLALLFAAAFGASPGCSFVVQDLTDRCSNDADCKGRGAAYENATCEDGLCRDNPSPRPPPPDNTPWGCLPTLTLTPPAVPTANISFRFVDPVDDRPVPGVEVRSCSNIDAFCMMPLAPPAVSDADGRTQLPFSTQNSAGSSGYLGYFYLSGADRMPHLFSVHPPMVADREASFRVVTQPEIETFAAIVGVTLDPQRSLLILQSRNCQNVATARSTFSIIGADDKTKLLYLSGGLPSLTATETDSSGTGFVANTVPGIVTVEIVNLDAGRRVSRTSVTVRQGHVTYAEIAPIPD